MRITGVRTRFFVVWLLLFPLFVMAAGCGGSEGSVSGKVTYKGKEIRSGTVFFYPEGKGGSFTSPIKEDGTYSISKLPVGPAKISVTAGGGAGPKLPKGMAMGMGAKKINEAMEKQKAKLGGPPEGRGGADSPGEQVSLPEQYGDPEKSGLKVDVTGGKQDHPIDLK